ncbi:serine hydrolase domain-containing protein [candidate division KSB1 bacterium]
MKRTTIFLFALIVLCTAVSCGNVDDGLTAARIDRIVNKLVPLESGEPVLDRSLEGRMEYYDVPGVSIAVINNFEIEWAEGFGILDKESGAPVTGRTLFQAASISKPVAAMAALKLAQDGRIGLSDNINNYLKTWKLPENEHTADRPVTLSHLLSHSGGTTVHGFRGYEPSEEIPTLRQVLNGESPANSDPVRVDMPPGTRYRYSGGGVTIMQVALMDITGRPFPGIAREYVLQPLGMLHSTYDQPLPSGLVQFAASGYRSNGREVEGKRHIYPEMAAAGLWTTPSDLAKFAIEVQLSIKGESNRVLSREMAERMVTAFADTVYGLGFSLTQKGYFGHSGSNEGFKCNLIAHLENGYGAVVMTNGDRGSLLIREILQAIAREYEWENYQ